MAVRIRAGRPSGSRCWSQNVNRFFKIFVSAATTFARAPRAAQVGMFLFFAASVSDGVLMPFFALWAHKDAGIPIQLLGLLLGCYAGGELLATPFFGGIADRVGRRPVLLVSTTGVGLGFLLLFMVRGAFAVAGGLIVIGVFESVLHPTASTVIADVVPMDARREHFAARRVMSNAGSMAGPALGALLALHSLGLVFLGGAVALLVGALVVAIFLHETRPSDPAADEENEESLLVLTAVFRDAHLAGLIIPIALLEIAESWIATITPLYADAAGTLTASGIGLLFTYAGALGVVLQMPITQATGHMRGFSIVMWSGAVQALAFACLLVSPALPFLVGAVTLLALAQMLAGPLVQTIVTELAPRNAQATYQAAFGVVNDLKDAAGPAIGTWLYALSSVLPWGTGIVASLVSSVALAAAARRHEARLAKN
jgi:MFS transporter, DHA1 family, tetracycline resistance protein